MAGGIKNDRQRRSDRRVHGYLERQYAGVTRIATSSDIQGAHGRTFHGLTDRTSKKLMETYRATRACSGTSCAAESPGPEPRCLYDAMELPSNAIHQI